MAEYEAVRLCEVGRRVGRLAKSGGKAVGRSRAASRAVGEVGRQVGGLAWEKSGRQVGGLEDQLSRGRIDLCKC